LAVEVSAEHDLAAPLTAALADLGQTGARLEATAERSILETLEAGCAAPLSSLASYTHGTLHLAAIDTAMDGSKTMRREGSTTIDVEAVTDATREIAYALGVEVANMLIADGADLLPAGPPRGTRGESF